MVLLFLYKDVHIKGKKNPSPELCVLWGSLETICHYACVNGRLEVSWGLPRTEKLSPCSKNPAISLIWFKVVVVSVMFLVETRVITNHWSRCDGCCMGGEFQEIHSFMSPMGLWIWGVPLWVCKKKDIGYGPREGGGKEVGLGCAFFRVHYRFQLHQRN